MGALKFRITAVLILCFSLGISAQERLLRKAEDKYQSYSFKPATDIYQKVIDKGYVSGDLLKKLGNAYYFNADYVKAQEIYQRLNTEYPEEMSAEYYFRYAQTLRTNGDYDQANQVMETFTKLAREDARGGKFLEDRDYMAEIAENSGRYEIGSFEYNSEYSDFAPALYKEGLIFSSDRDTGNLARYRHSWNAMDFLDLYKVNADSASRNKVTKLDFANSRLHESTSVATKDGQTVYFTRNNFKEKKYKRDEAGFVRLRIFKATLLEDGSMELVDLPFNSDSYSVAHPALSPDERYLYFASDMPGTLGESDLFRVRINDDGTYGTPENLGPKINTEARETFPFISSENILYFASDGHPGLGGLDVFATKLSRLPFLGKVMNVGEEVNSKWDDFTFVFVEETRKGYFASNRDGGMGGDDIYSFVETRPLEFDCLQQITGTVRDKISNEVLVGATVKVIDENNEEILSVITNANGEFSLRIDCNQGNFIRASMQGYVPSEEYLAVSDGKPRVMDFYLERDTVIAGYGDDLAKLLQLSTIYFDFDSSRIRPDAEIEIQKVIAAMEKYPSLKIKANSHTDSRGPDAYNLWLSQQRAEATVNYMISKGIDASRLQGEGFGETRLINRCANGVRCSDTDHELNRRSEFIILE